MQRSIYEKYAKKLFKGKLRKVVLNQIDNFYQLKDKPLKHKKYKLGDSVVLNKTTLMTGFKYEPEYLEIIAKEGKVCGDFVGIDTRHGVKYAVSTWKFDKKTTLHDYAIKYSGMTAVVGKDYVIVPYGKLDEFVESIRDEEYFCWEAESTREMRFLPNLAKVNDQIALIFDMKDSSCDNLMAHNLMLESMPTKLRVMPNPNERNKTRKVMEQGFGKRTAYILFGIPANCIEGIFVNQNIEKDPSILKYIKSLLPTCYICNVDGKVIVE